jgi:hypothetical protein
MRKITMLIISVLVSTMGFAQVQTFPVNKAGAKFGTGKAQKASVQKNENKPVFKTVNLSSKMMSVVSQNAIDAAKLSIKNESKSLNANVKATKKRANDNEGVITTPKGTPKTYALTTYVSDGQNTSGYLGGYCDTVYVDGKDVYFKNIVFLVGDGSYVKGTITNGDEHNGTITIANGQQCAKGYYAYIGGADDNGYLTVDQDTPNFTFSIRNDSIFSDPVEATGELYLLGVDANAQLTCYNNTYKYEPVDASKLTTESLPEGIDTVTYKVSSFKFHTLLAGKKEFVKVGKNDNDLYLTQLKSMPNAVVKGTIVDGKVEVKMPLYLGMSQNRFIFLRAAKLVAGYDENKGDSTLKYELIDDDKIVCDYDASTGKIKAKEFMVLTAGSTLVGYLNEPLFEPSNDVPVVVPATAENITYAMSTVLDPSDMTYRTSTKTIVARDGDDFYFKGISCLDSEAAFKGTLKGDSIYVSVPQYIGKLDKYYIYLSRMDAVSSSFSTRLVPNDDTEPLRFFYDKTSGTITSEDLFGTASIEGLSDIDLSYPIWTVFNDVVATVPADAIIEKYVLSKSSLDEKTKDKSIVRIAHKDNTYYFMDIDAKDSLAVFVGTRSGNKISCTIPQYVGGTNLDYLKVAYKPFKVLGSRGDSVWTYKLTEDKQLVFNCDEANNVMSSDSLVMFMTIDNNYYNNYYKPVYSKYTPYAATPADPKPISWADYTAFYGQYMFVVDIPDEAGNGDFIDPSGMTFSIYFDDSTTPYVFDAARYGKDFTEDTDEVPYKHQSYDFGIDGTSHTVFLYDAPEKKIGISSSYTYNGVKNSSKIVYFELPTEGINDVNATNVKNEMYYDMTGRRVVKPAHGLFIHKVMSSDGTSRAYKEVIK